MLYDPAKPVNEIGQIIVNLPKHSYRSTNFILVQDEGCEYRIFSPYPDRTSFQSQDVIARMCGTRAKFTVQGGLLLNGKKVKPQQYLRHWRGIEPVEIADLQRKHGFALYAKVALNLDAERSNKWSSCVDERFTGLKSFSAFEAKYGDLFTLNPDNGLHESEFDLVDSDISLDLERMFSNIYYTRERGYLSTLRFRIEKTTVQPLQDVPLAAVSDSQLELLDMF